MSSELDKLVETITDLVLGELSGEFSTAKKPVVSNQVQNPKAVGTGAKVLVVPGPRKGESSVWESIRHEKACRLSMLFWDGFGQKRLPTDVVNWAPATGGSDWSAVAGSHQAVVLLGADLSVLGSLASFGTGNCVPAALAVEAIGKGLPVFIDDHHFESLRRHSSRLASGFVGRFEELYRVVASFGVEFGSSLRLSEFLARQSGAAHSAPSPVATRSGGRDVVTAEDVDAVKRTGETALRVARGTIVTPLARQRAQECGIEVVIQ